MATIQSKWASTTLTPSKYYSTQIASSESTVNDQLDTLKLEVKIAKDESDKAYINMLASGATAITPLGTGPNAGGMIGSRDNPQI